jgi:Rieske Fe-S protein
MNTNNNSRRAFIKKLFTISVFATVTPKLLAQLEPTIFNKDDKLMGEYSLNINDFPDLSLLWKSVRINIFSVNENKNINVIITKVPFETYGTDYVAVKNVCPHQGGAMIGVNSVSHNFVCSIHGSIFDVSGNYISGIANANLTKYSANFDSNNGILKINVDFDVLAVDEFSEMTILKQNYPNPSKDLTLIEFGTEKSSTVKLELYDLNGNIINTIFEATDFSGMSSVSLNTSNLISGNYFYKLIVNGKDMASRHLQVIK